MPVPERNPLLGNKAMLPASVRDVQVTQRPLLTAFLLLLGDLLALVFSLGAPVYLWNLWKGDVSVDAHFSLWPVVLFFLSAYAFMGLYPGAAISPVEELRRLFGATSLVFGGLVAFLFFTKEEPVYSRAIVLLAWGLVLICVPLSRAFMRYLFASRPWWGVPTVVLGAGRTAEILVRNLKRWPGLGLKVVAFLDDDPEKWGKAIEGVPVLGGLGLAGELRGKGISYAVLAMPGVRRERLLEILEEQGKQFPHLLLIPDLLGMASLFVSPRDLGGLLGLEIRQNLLLPWPRTFKRVFDVVVSAFLLVVLLPLFLLIALLIKLSSPGPVFYGHLRVGQGGKQFRAWKFRTMVQNADCVLSYYLEAHPELRVEWERDQKLKKDPRVTPIGRILRKTSLDELPQLWNVLKGEMSLVGPRPIVEGEVSKYGPFFGVYLRVRPGVTGLWQVSGRNETGYEERVNLDAYYVRNWSPWLDFYILARTVWVVLTGKGAY